MKISAPCVVSLSWTLSDAQGHVIDTLDEPVEFFYGGDDLLPRSVVAVQLDPVAQATRLDRREAPGRRRGDAGAGRHGHGRSLSGGQEI